LKQNDYLHCPKQLCPLERTTSARRQQKAMRESFHVSADVLIPAQKRTRAAA